MSTTLQERIAAKKRIRYGVRWKSARVRRQQPIGSGSLDLWPGQCVYRMYGRGGVLLYIGVSESLVSRIATHLKDTPWGRRTERIEWEVFASRDVALQREGVLIGALHPLYNIAGNLNWDGPIPLGSPLDSQIAELHKSNRQLASGE